MTQEKLHRLFKDAIEEKNLDGILNAVGHDEMNLNFRDVTHDMETPLMQLCHSSLNDAFIETSLLGTITEKTCDVNLQDALGRTLAMHACIALRTSIVDYVMTRDHDVTICDRTGRNVYHYGACSGNERIIELLLKHPKAKSALRVLDYKGKCY